MLFIEMGMFMSMFGKMINDRMTKSQNKWITQVVINKHQTNTKTRKNNNNINNNNNNNHNNKENKIKTFSFSDVR